MTSALQRTTAGTIWNAWARAPSSGRVLPILLIALYCAQVAWPLLTTRLADVSEGRDLGRELVGTWGLSGQSLEEGRWLTLFTSMFLHANLTHIVMNASVAGSVGPPVSIALGKGIGGFLRFWLFFAVTGVAAGLTYVALHPESNVPVIGASGALSGLWAGYARVPAQPGPLEPPWSARALRLAAPFFLINVVLMGVMARISGLPVAWEAHLGGFVAGLLFIGLFVPARDPIPAAEGA